MSDSTDPNSPFLKAAGEGKILASKGEKSFLELVVHCCRGGFMCGCCAPLSLKIKEARGQPEDEEAAGDANVVNGGDVDSTDDDVPDKGGPKVVGPENV